MQLWNVDVHGRSMVVQAKSAQDILGQQPVVAMTKEARLTAASRLLHQRREDWRGDEYF